MTFILTFLVPLPFFFQKNAKAEELYNQVFYTLDVVEKDYFGLSFLDAQNVVVCTFHLSLKSNFS